MDEITLISHTPLEVTPTLAFSTIQNRSSEASGILYISSHGDLNKVWIELQPGSSVKFDKPLYFMQKTGKDMKIPVIEGS